MGEIGAAWAAGCLSLDQALDVVIARSRHQEQTRGSGAMAALMLGEREARRVVEGARVSAVSVAAINSWRSVTLSGPSDEIDRVVAAAAELRISARRLDLDYPFHSALVDPVRSPLMRELAGLRSRQARKRFISSVTGTALDGPELVADHWWHNVRDPVQFDAGLKCLLTDGFQVFVEIGPKPILGSYIRDILREAEIRGTSVESLTETDEADAGAPLERTVSRVVLAGGQVDSIRFFGPPPAVAVPLPAYPWRHAQFKVRPTVEATAVFAPVRHPLLGSRPHADSLEWFSTVDPVLLPWIADHKVGGIPVFPRNRRHGIPLAPARRRVGLGAECAGHRRPRPGERRASPGAGGAGRECLRAEGKGLRNIERPGFRLRTVVSAHSSRVVPRAEAGGCRARPGIGPAPGRGHRLHGP